MRRTTRALTLRSKPRPAEDAFWLNNDIVLYMVQYLCLLDLVQFSQVNGIFIDEGRLLIVVL